MLCSLSQESDCKQRNSFMHETYGEQNHRIVGQKSSENGKRHPARTTPIKARSFLLILPSAFPSELSGWESGLF